MTFTLYEHNKTAYEKASLMLKQEGKAAIIHPTGTGKSFIGFQLCIDHPDSVICWAAPSEYIFQTQIENLIHAGGEYPKNIRFYTYARLMNMSMAEIQLICPDYIILDEFHRCGAEMWGQGITKLLKIYTETPILGLTATAIRYLDNHRNMAEELFDGKIASEITLGEAIVRNILQVPVYIVGMYSYQKELEKYESRIQNERNPILREKADLYLEALRRSLEKADGVSELFQKYMEDRCGKYLVFCSDYEHMEEMMSFVPEWFGEIDSAPHVYQAYSENPDTNKEFQRFKEDSSNHLKLLFCIDMLNEGIHMNDISGVILLRPTTSPIVYQQQIGRALSANKSRTPYIFDLVANIDGLYSIAELQEEITVAMHYYHSYGEKMELVNEPFRLYGEVRECLKLFEQLTETLHVSWDKMYRLACEYYQQQGDLEVPYTYKTEEGYSLGSWIATMRNARKGTVDRGITEHQIALLDQIGMRWENKTDYIWNRNYTELEKYLETNGDIDVPFSYVTETGIQLGHWVNSLRAIGNFGEQNPMLSEERIHALDRLGMIWDKSNYLWERNYEALSSYYIAHGNVNVPKTYKTNDGLALGSWLYNIQNQYRKFGAGTLDQNKKERLEALGVEFPEIAYAESDWYDKYEKAKAYYREFGNLDVPYGYVTPDGFALGNWIRRHRSSAGKEPVIRVSRERKALLEEIGMVWEIESGRESWDSYFAVAKDFWLKHGNWELDEVEDKALSKWLSRQSTSKKKGTLSIEKIRKLDEIHFHWLTENERKWEMHFQEAKVFFERNGHLNITPTNSVLGRWVNMQRKKQAEGGLTGELVQRLEEIGMIWKREELCCEM